MMMYIDLMTCILWRCMIYIRCDCWEILYMHVDVICWRRSVYFLNICLFVCSVALIEIGRYSVPTRALTPKSVRSSRENAANIGVGSVTW